MELGNAVFGISRGPYPIRRGAGWEEELFRLFDAYAPKRDNSWREYGEEFDNDTFSVSPYYWGDCECGWDEFSGEAEDLFGGLSSHGPDCYQTRIDDIERSTSQGEKRIKAICEEMGLSYPGGSAIHCTCGHDINYASFMDSAADQFGGDPERGHLPGCLITKPNFLYKPTGFEIMWYKYPLRDSYMSKKISLGEFKKIIDLCVASVGASKQRGDKR